MYIRENNKYYKDGKEITPEEYYQATNVPVAESVPDPEPASVIEKIEAQVLFTALVTDTLIEE